MTGELVPLTARSVEVVRFYHHNFGRAMAAAVTVNLAAVEASRHPAFLTSARRFTAGAVILLAGSVARRATRLLPVDAPSRIYLTGLQDAELLPFTWRQLPAWARSRPTLRQSVR